MTVKELREALEPYGTRYRLTMTKAQLEEALRNIQANEAKYGQAQRPFGVFGDEERRKETEGDGRDN